MGLRRFKPVTPSRRFSLLPDYSEVTKVEPEKSLIEPLKKKAGRNHHGRVTVRHQGGGHKRMYRIIDFRRNKFGIPARVEAIEYDPNRTARIALLVYPLENIPVGTIVHNIEFQPGKGGQIARSAGTYAQLMAKEGRYALLRMPSGELRKVIVKCMATIGMVGNEEHSNEVHGKAGRKRWLGVRPTVRGMTMNPVDHPMGGGEGKSKGHIPQSPWGMPAKGYKTRRRKKPSDKLIVKRRNQI